MIWTSDRGCTTATPRWSVRSEINLPLSFESFNKGSQLVVLVPQICASTVGKLDFEFEYRPGEKLTASAFVSN
jgi:hypothetical protein